ncbi:hypothetical protein N180_13655 [Pedobacter antarcticus 4BY]|uniref:Iron dicitrate transport regulator FecR n=2 Tax=Pedobacter antarcticus TaxID=34086 RepID=A0A081PE73_9SPHI|nr:FecR domain-containing protein [Pedobacter antarcticus]KEQ28996.1 hypothetical protein N180_13655 [Pedobacter antarcticus 4BY]SFF45864.1 FecR family protein [Pedobacter antarcticus]
MSEDKRDLELLFIEKFLGTLSVEMDQYANDLIASSEEAAELWEQVQVKLGSSSSSHRIAQFDPQSRWEKFESRIEENRHSKPKKRRLRVFIPYLSAAALVLLIPFVWLYFIKKESGDQVPVLADTVLPAKQGVLLSMEDGQVLKLDKGTMDMNLNQARIKVEDGKLSYVPSDMAIAERITTLSVPAGQDYKIELSDGTEIWMNASSSLKFPLRFNGKQREVTLVGEAYFKVQKDANRPFVVHTEGNQVIVMGTSFNINAYNKEDYVASLVEGKIKAVKGNQQIMLVPGKQVIMENNQMKEQPFDQSHILSWMDGLYYFNDKPLVELSAVIERWFNVKVIVSQAIKGKRFTGAFEKNKPLNEVMTNLRLSGDVKSNLKAGVLYLN